MQCSSQRPPATQRSPTLCWLIANASRSQPVSLSLSLSVCFSQIWHGNSLKFRHSSCLILFDAAGTHCSQFSCVFRMFSVSVSVWRRRSLRVQVCQEETLRAQRESSERGTEREHDLNGCDHDGHGYNYSCVCIVVHVWVKRQRETEGQSRRNNNISNTHTNTP